MNEKRIVCSGFTNTSWGRTLSLLFMLALLVPLLAMAAPDVAARAQPALLAMAAERPEATVGVIVQKVAKDTSVEDLVARLGGRATKDLRIINAFAAELPARAVPKLAKAAGVRWVSLDTPVVQASMTCPECIDLTDLQNAYVQAIGATRLWNAGPKFLQGQDVTVAVVDSGVATHTDLKEVARGKGFRILAAGNFNNTSNNAVDKYGHGTHLAGIIGGNGTASGGAYIGVAPKVNLVNIKVTNDQGAGMTSDVVAGLEWVLNNKDTYNIRVVNVSLNSNVPESYHESPLDAALEILWFNRIVVVVPVGNVVTSGPDYPPGNDPFVITVGAVDDQGTADPDDDVLASYSAYGKTQDRFFKPDLVAPGTDIISLLASPGCLLAAEHPDHVVSVNKGGNGYFRMSGTSMASAVTAGAVALLLQDEPDLNPDQVKYRLMATARRFDTPKRVGSGYLDIYEAVHGTTTRTANTRTAASLLLWTGSSPANWGSVNWGSVNWGSVNWGSVNWGSVNWGSVNWGSDHWGD
jgi:serine protease AprX